MKSITLFEAKTEDTPLINRRRSMLMLTVLLVISFAVRFPWITQGEFHYDDVALVLLAQAHADGEFQYFGIPSSNSGLNFPASVHFLSLLFRLSPDIYGVTVGIVIFNVMGIGLFWLLARRLFNARIAFVAAFLFAVSPWAIQYSRRIWAQEFNSPFLLAGMLFAIYGFTDGKKWAQFLSLPLLVFGMQIHFAAFALIPAYAVIVWIGRKRIDWRFFLVSAALAALVSAPFFVGVLSGKTDAPTILDRFSAQATETAQALSDNVTASPFQGLLNATSGVGLPSYYNYSPDRLSLSPYLDAFAVLLWVAALIGLIVGLRNRRWTTVWLLIWVLPAVIIMAVGVVGAHMFYFIMLMPPLLMIVALGLHWLTARLPKRGSTAALVAFLGVLGLTQVGYMAQFFDRVWNEPFAYMTPVGYLLEVRDQLPPTDDLIMIGSRNLLSEGAIWSTLLYRRDICVRELAMDGGADLTIVPAHPFLVMVGPEGTENARYVNETRTELPLRNGDPPYVLYRFEAPPEPPLENALRDIPTMNFADALQLRQAGMANGRVSLGFEVTRIDRSQSQFFVHFLDAAGERIAQFDSPFYPGTHWCMNDRYYLTFDAPAIDGLSERTATLRVGMYHLEQGSITGIDAFDASGNRFPWVDIPLEGR